jgi:hypothetical protein
MVSRHASDSRHVCNGSGTRNRQFKRWILSTLKFAFLRFCAFRKKTCAGTNMFLPAQKRKKTRLSAPSLMTNQ